jgi:epoxyqueuosine reductase
LQKSELTQHIRLAAAEMGFAQVGFSPAVSPTGYHRLLEWLASGYAGSMQWIDRRRDAYESPQGVMIGTKSVVVVALNYSDGQAHEPGARLSRYAWGRTDYHTVLRGRLQSLAEAVHDACPKARTRVVVDTAPLLERDFAQLAGIGWFGKNTMLISRSIGSWFFLGALLTDVELDYDQPYEDTWCGTCTRCLDECPTDAFPEPGVLDARRCISYLTIELRDTPIPRELRPHMGNWVFGCDICQDVCPWNRFAPTETISEFRGAPGTNPLDCRALLRLTEPEFNARFKDTPLERPGYSGVRRNAAIVLGNLNDVSSEPELSAVLSDDDPVVRGAAAWAMGQLQSTTVASKLRHRLQHEQHADVRTEIELALDVCPDSASPPIKSNCRKESV